MKIISIFLIAIAVKSPIQFALAAEDIAPTRREMESMIERFSLPSLSVAIAIDGKIVFAEAVGFANVESAILADSRTPYSVGSTAKAMTSLAIAKLLDDGKLELDTDIHQYLPDYPKLEHKVTVRQLASHTAGIVRAPPERKQREFILVRDHESPMEALDIFSQRALLFEPGTEFQYSSCGYILLSAVIESAAEKNFIAYMEEEIWSKLGMYHTDHDTSDAGFGKEAEYYDSKANKGRFTPSVSKRDRSFLFGGGGFISTPSDLVRMAFAFRDSGFISAESKKQLTTPVKLQGGEMNPQNYALGWRIGSIQVNPEEIKYLTLHHGGATNDAANAYIFYIPKLDAAISYTTNTEPANIGELRMQIMNLLLSYIHTRKQSQQ